MSDIEDSPIADRIEDESRIELITAFREFEATIWRHINGRDDDADRRELAQWASGELERIQENLDTEIDIVS